MKIKSAIILCTLLAAPACDGEDAEGFESSASADDRGPPEPGRYTVTAENLMVRSKAQSYAMGRLVKGQAMDIHYGDDNGWAYGFAYGDVNRCVWVQFSVTDDKGATTTYFDVTQHDEHKKQCDEEHKNIEPEEFTQRTNGDPNSGSSTKINACGHADHWNNWNWNEKTGVPASRGLLPEGTGVEWRYITIDGAGAMVMLAKDDWVFVPSDCLSV